MDTHVVQTLISATSLTHGVFAFNDFTVDILKIVHQPLKNHLEEAVEIWCLNRKSEPYIKDLIGAIQANNIDSLPLTAMTKQAIISLCVSNPLIKKEAKMDEVIIEVTPEAFEEYQAKIQRTGLAKITFIQYKADRIKVETEKAILVQQDDLVCWIPKSCLYNVSEKDSGVAFYVRKDFPLNWYPDSQ